jgi:hypothetical protein
MRQEGRAFIIVLLVAFFCVVATGVAKAEKKMPDTAVLKLEGAKLGPVTFSHITHSGKAKIDCAVCHHKDKNPKEPEKCETCHLLKEVKEKAPPTKDAFHTKCQTCHKENVAKGGGAPVKCNDCHKK